ncbi:hypothetical protein Tco_0853712 [Tanacetum coccineum]
MKYNPPNLLLNLALLLIKERYKIKSISTLYPSLNVQEVQHLLILSTSKSACDTEYYNVTPLSDSYNPSVFEGMSRSVPEGVSRSVPEGVSRSVPEGMSRSVPEGMSRSVPEGMSRSVPEGMSRSVPS